MKLYKAILNPLKNINFQGSLKQVSSYARDKTKVIAAELATFRHKMKNIPETNYELGIRHLIYGNLNDATMRFKLVTYLNAKHQKAYIGLAEALLLQNNKKEALSAIKKALTINPQDKIALYIKNKIEKPATISKIPFEYIKEKEEKIAKYELGYLLEDDELNLQILTKQILFQIKDKNPNLTILHIRSNEGIFGQIIKEKDVAKHVIAIEFSAQLIKHAKALKTRKEKIYDEVVQSSIEGFLKATQKKYDLIVSSLLCGLYGKLDECMQLMNDRLINGGIVALLVETDQNCKNYRFDPENDRFVHNVNAIKKTMTKYGLFILNSQPLDDGRGTQLLIATNKKQ